MSNFKTFCFISLSLLFYSCTPELSDNLFIRITQVGFLPEDYKSAVVISKIPLDEKIFTIKNSDNNQTILIDSIKLIPLKLNSSFLYSALIEFSELKQTGEYIIEYQNVKSYGFKIDTTLFNSVRDSLSLFFKVQRCGPTNPLLHNVCHLQDATKVIGYSDSSAVDLTGGWHDAGDYIKFLYTTAFTTYLLLFSYEFAPEKFSFDLDDDTVPDILQEARIGLDFLLRCNFADDAFISQVQNDQDHNVGWRLPENDTLTFNRPAYVKMTRSQIGIYSAALSLASRIWKQKFYDDEFSGTCSETAIKIFQMRNKILDYPDEEKYYKQNEYHSKLALAAVEIFKSTHDEQYLNFALDYGKHIKQNNWWSWGNLNALVFYKLAEFDSNYIFRLKSILTFYLDNSQSNLFGEAHPLNWGTTHSLAGTVLSSILYKKLTGSTEFDKQANINRDYILGRNPWGITFIHNIGQKFPKRIHHQVGYFNNGYIPGAMVSGPVADSLIKQNNPEIGDDYFKKFSGPAIYADEYNNYLTNEPTIASNATALFIFGYYSGER